MISTKKPSWCVSTSCVSVQHPLRRRRRQQQQQLATVPVRTSSSWPARPTPLLRATMAAICTDWLNPVSPRWNAATNAINSFADSYIKASSVNVRNSSPVEIRMAHTHAHGRIFKIKISNYFHSCNVFFFLCDFDVSVVQLVV